jgi:tetratricopeptide (TPR) repeat protein
MLLLLLAVHAQHPDGGGCTRAPAVAAAVDSGWRAYRQGALEDAGAQFAAAAAACPGAAGPAIGAGFVLLRRGRAAPAEERFRRALAADTMAADAWYGLGVALARLGQRSAAAPALRRALEFAPRYTEAEDQLLALGVDSGLAPAPRPPPREPQIPARVAGERFEVRTRDGAGWQPFYVKGINLGAALPGKFPSEAPLDDSSYARWLELIAAANANAVRVYTILPPAFYRALRRWNDAHPDQALWVVHGVWAELPPKGNYDAADWLKEFRHEMRRVVDVVHGRALLAARAGHAWGRYDADVSDHMLAFVLGREWEPFSIKAYNRRPHGRGAYRGRFLAVERGTPADVWLAEQCDALLQYEWDAYRAQRPIAYTNWPPLDPLRHATESTREEEQVLRRRYGFPPNPRLKEYDNDAETLDAMLVQTTAANRAGYFAAYHAYPYYPDFIDLDPGYGAARSAAGASHYFGYLLDLKRHHAGRALLIAEYGVPSSRGISHLQPEGMHHGGHDERAMAAVDVRLSQEIREAGLAGGIVFAWLDEWFKHTWVTIDLELPTERTRLWHNVMDAEQNYGLLGEYAGAAAATPEPGGDPARWRALPVLERDETVALRVGADASYLYVGLEGGPSLDSVRYVVGLDTYASAGGERTLPGLSLASDVGFEFAVVLNDTADAQLLVASWYNPFLVPRPASGPTALDAFYNWGAALEHPRSRPGGGWDSLFVTTNRWRIARDGRTFPAQGVNRGRLRYARADSSSLADWYVDRAAELVEVRLAWGLLNVTDPSSRRVLRRIAPPDRFATTVTDGFRIAVAATARGDGAMRVWLPAHATYSWPTWEEPVWHERLKPVYAALRDLWASW